MTVELGFLRHTAIKKASSTSSLVILGCIDQPTTHYSAAELTRLIEAANTVCSRGDKKPELVVLRRLSVS